MFIISRTLLVSSLLWEVQWVTFLKEKIELWQLSRSTVTLSIFEFIQYFHKFSYFSFEYTLTVLCSIFLFIVISLSLWVWLTHKMSLFTRNLKVVVASSIYPKMVGSIFLSRIKNTCIPDTFTYTNFKA